MEYKNNNDFLYKSKSPKSITSSTSYNFEKYKSFNRSFGSPFKLSLTIFNNKNKDKIREKCWEELTNTIINNYNAKKGTRVKDFGVFTFINLKQSKENDFYHFNNKQVNDIPVFIVNESFIDYIKPGIYDDKNGLTYLNNKKYSLNKSIEIEDINYQKLSKKVNISKDKFEETILYIIDDIKDKIKQQIFNAKKMEGLGIFLRRGNIFGMRFNNKMEMVYINNLKTDYNLFPTKIRLKKHLIKPLNENDKNYGSKIDYKSNILINLNKINKKIKQQNKEQNENNYVNSVDDKSIVKFNDSLRNFNLLKLKSLNIKKEIWKEIYNTKDILLQKIKENNNNDFILKENLINIFLNYNEFLDFETINKIINIYDKNKTTIEYNKLINNLFNDIQKILNNGEKNLVNIKLDSKKSNFKSDKLPNIKIINYENKKDKIITEEEEKLYKMKNIISSYSSKHYVNLVPYEEISKELKQNDVNLDKNEFQNFFELKVLSDEQLIDLTDCILKITKKIKRIIAKNIIENLNKKNVDRERDKLYITNYRNSLTEIERNKKLKTFSNNNNLFLSYCKNGFNESSKYLEKTNELISMNKNEELIVNLIKILKEKIYQEGKNQEKINEYFEHLLSYNKNRKSNVIYLNEFDLFLKYEGFNLSSQEVTELFNYIDIYNKGYIDRLQFINAIKIIPFPITIVQKYFQSHKLSVLDIAFKMEIDLYNNNFEKISNRLLHSIEFFSKMKSVNYEFEQNFINSLFISLTGNINKKLSCKKMFEIFNVYNKSIFSYLNIYENKDKINNYFISLICNDIPFLELKEKLFSSDPKSTGKYFYPEFFLVINNLLNGKIKSQNFIHFLRINKLIKVNDEIDYIDFLRFIDSKYPDTSFEQCLKQLAEILDKDCNRDIFIFTIKLNNMNNNSSTNEVINPEKLYYYFKENNEYLKFETIKKFDYNDDGIITSTDIKNTLLKYYDPHFFDNMKIINQNKKEKEEYELQKKIIDFYKYIIALLKKNDLTENNFFLYLDKNKDEVIDKEEFVSQLMELKYFEIEKYDINKIENFYNFLDEFKNNKVNLDIFTNKFRYLHDELNKENKNISFGEKKNNFILEDLILNEFCIWYMDNKDSYTEEEIFSMIDEDNDGIISTNDLKNFVNKILFLSKNELYDTKISNLIHIISLNKENNNISLADLHQLFDCIKRDDIKKYKEDILVNYIKGKNDIWIKYIVKELKIQINKKYGDNIEKMYNKYNVHFYQNKGQGLSIDNFELLILKNLNFFENYHLEKNELLMLFNYISNNKKFISLNDLKFHFSVNQENTNSSLKEFNYIDFFETMHNTIKQFLNKNFSLCEEAFLFFQHNTNENKKKIRNFITIKEFFDGVNYLFPNKYETETILNYIKKIFKINNFHDETNSNQLKNIKYEEFKDIYYKNVIGIINNLKQFSYKFDSPRKKSRNNILSYSFDNKKKYNLRTIIITPIEKLKRILRHSEIKSKIEIIYDYIIKSENGSGSINKYQFFNLLKKLKLSLTNSEIEDIIEKGEFLCDGFIDLYKFLNCIFNEDYNLEINKRNIESKLSEIKDLIIKYYTIPLLAFELNIESQTNNYLNFEYFKNLIYEIYQKEKKSPLSFPVIKCLYDYIDYKKDGIITIDEWNNIFSKINGSLDKSNFKTSKSTGKQNFKDINLKEWENSNEIIRIFKLISKNRKLIKEKFKLYSVAPSCLLINSNDLIQILKEVLYNVNLSNEQWKIIINIGKKNKSDFVDFKTFITIIEYASKII